MSLDRFVDRAIVSRSLFDLHPRMQPLARLHLEQCVSRLNVYESVLVTCTWRSDSAQAELYAKGRTVPGKVVTWAKPGESFHNYVRAGAPAALAYDVVALRHGRTIWGTSGDGIDNDPTDDERDDLELWERMAACAVGLEWAGRWSKGKREFPHFEHPQAAEIRARGE